MTRQVGIRHRVKATKEGEARPTMVAIRADDRTVVHELATETDELDFLTGRFPVEWRELQDDEKVEWYDLKSANNGVRPHQCKWKVLKKDEDLSKLDPYRIVRIGDGKTRYLQKIPSAFEGLRAGDVVGMVLGGSGDRFAAALSRRGEDIGATVWRIQPFRLKDLRADASIDNDHLLLASLVETKQEVFYLLRRRDREGIRVREALDIRQQAMKARIGCEQRMLQALIGTSFLNEAGHFPEGVIEEEFDRMKANDGIFQALEREEQLRDKELERAVKAVGIWKAIFDGIQGCGPRIAAGLIAPIGDIRRFWQEPDPVEMGKLYQRSKALEEQGEFEQCKVHVAHRLTSGMPQFQALQIVRSWQATNDKNAQAQMLTEAIECHKKRHKLRQQAFHKGMAKLKAFCGVHCVDGKFARRRVGQTSNWNPIARQTLWLLGDQFNRRPDSEWGKKLLEYKAKLRVTHPEPIEVESSTAGGKKVKRYTDGHIHKMATWKTLSKFVEALFKAWTRIEHEAHGAALTQSSAA
ncbi:MAG: hypothetical protein ABIP54_02910 [Candidatus Andersenbacteria bacterium]